MVANCEQYNGKRSILGRLANRLLHYFKECWSECQPVTPQLDDDIDALNHRENPLKKSTIITRDKNNNTRTRKNYRQLAGLSDDDDDDNEPEYTPIPSSKRARHSTSSVPIYITVDPNSPAYVVYHDHSYFVRLESINSSVDDVQRRKTSIPINNIQEKPSLPSVQVLNQLLLERPQIAKISQSDSSTSTNPIDITAILRALLVKQGHQLTSTIPKETIETKINDNTSSSPSSTTTS
ncbi:unnamed protein product [Rotaria sordida]|uniref:Uncharacterized protein n=1 Tax=Rotaria sordida TaxID=392033 RepID=A0A814BU40_9BILA|nr:unnamed protein product [Rotaria sordida]CAF0930842.1 unnamed protein product [Rotaria sordida]